MDTTFLVKFISKNQLRFRIRPFALCIIVLASWSFTGTANANCDEGQQQVAELLVKKAQASTDEIERLVQLKESLKACPQFVGWFELGKVQLELDNTRDATLAFESARDFYQPDAQGTYTADEMQRVAVSNAWLAEAYKRNGDIAPASVAIQESTRSFNAVGLAPPQRLVELQGEIDDELAQTDASVLTRSLNIQHQRATRGIGVRRATQENELTANAQVLTDRIATEYAGTSLTSLDTGSTASLPQPSDTQLASESRLNIPVLFAFDSDELSAEGAATINQLSQAINALSLSSDATVVIAGHTDSVGDAGYNMGLSQRRANAVLAAILPMVQSQPIFDSQGRGETELRYAETTSNDRRRNRRVELIIRR
ncbi:OmpA family protein [bacterium]|nr:OmpA family protein [bacterium]